MDDRRAVARAAAAALVRMATPARTPLPHQVPPPGRWYGWALIGGRGSGKTEACARYVVDHVNGPPCLPGPVPHWIGIIAPTLGDAATSCFYGPSGIRALDPATQLAGPDEVLRRIEDYVGDATNFPVDRLEQPAAQRAVTRLSSGAGGLSVRWPNGSEAKLFGAHSPEDVERLRAGGNRCVTWCEELAAWRHLDDAWHQMRFGLRTGPRPHWVGSTTPKPRPLIRGLVQGDEPDTVVTRATMWDNPHLPAEIRRALEEAYGSVRLGRQELYAELIDEDENALWTRQTLDRGRLVVAPELRKISVGVDPSGGAGEQGIVVVGSSRDWVVVDAKRRLVADGYVLDDRSCRMSPDGWGRRAVQAAVDWEADDVVVEVNFGGEMAVAVVRGAADQLGVALPVRQVRASRGKRARAEPVAALAERGRFHHVGNFPELEDQMCTWTEASGYSPDRLDAAVWPPWHMKLVGVQLVATGSFPGSAVGQRIDR